MSDTQGATTESADPNDMLQANNVVDEALQVVTQDAQAVVAEASALEALVQAFQADVENFIAQNAPIWSQSTIDLQNEVEAWQAKTAQDQADAEEQASGAATITPEQMQILKQKIANAIPPAQANDAADDAADAPTKASPAKGGGKGSAAKSSN